MDHFKSLKFFGCISCIITVKCLDKCIGDISDLSLCFQHFSYSKEIHRAVVHCFQCPCSRRTEEIVSNFPLKFVKSSSSSTRSRDKTGRDDFPLIKQRPVTESPCKIYLKFSDEIGHKTLNRDIAAGHVILAHVPHSSMLFCFPKSFKCEHMPRIITTNFLIKAIQKDYTFRVNFLQAECIFARLTPHKSYQDPVFVTRNDTLLPNKDHFFGQMVPLKFRSAVCSVSSDWYLQLTNVCKLSNNIDRPRFFPVIKFYLERYFLGFISYCVNVLQFNVFCDILQDPLLSLSQTALVAIYLVNFSPFCNQTNSVNTWNLISYFDSTRNTVGHRLGHNIFT
jgi:hypothetical protein